MDLAALVRWRMHRQLLWGSEARSPEDVIGHLGASQGQDYLPGTWSLAQRCRVVPEHTVVDGALDDGRILRTHVLRPTWHLVAPSALPWLLAATAPRVHQVNKHYYREVEVDEELMARVRPVLDDLLSDHHASRDEVRRALADAGIEATGVRLAYLLMWAELEAWIVSGRRAGKQQTYALVEERVPDFVLPPRDEALGRLAACYFTSRGPATVRDLARWATLTIAEATQARDVAGDALEDLEVDGRNYLVGAGQTPPPRPTDTGALRTDLVQQYDEIGMSYGESRDVMAGDQKLTFGPDSGFYHPVIVDAHLAGFWRYQRDGSGRPEAVETRADDAVSNAHLDDAVRAFSLFAGGPVEHRFV